MSGTTKKRIALATLGCKVNYCDMEALATLFKKHGFELVDFDQEADVYVVNTCCVTSVAASKSRQKLRKAINEHPGALVAATGCYAQTAADELAGIPGIGIISGVQPRASLVEQVEAILAGLVPEDVKQPARAATFRQFEEIPTSFSEGRVRAFVKIQDGCNESCAFCIIPRARGPSRSRRPEKVLAEVQDLMAQGFGEIVLTGINLGSWGLDLPGEWRLARLVEELARLPEMKRLRLSSIDPHQVSDELLEVMAGHPEVMCRHLHISAQSGCDKILEAMRRRHSADDFRQLVERMRRLIPEVAVTTDIIVGFPGETEADFEATCRFCREMAFSRINVFPFSRRKGTIAYNMPDQVPSEVKKERVRRLMELADELSLQFHEGVIGKTVNVLVEGTSDAYPGYMQGLTDNYIRVHLPVPVSGNKALDKGIPLGQLVPATPVSAFSFGVKAN